MRTLFGCCLIHLCIGSIYAASVLYVPIIAQTGWDPSVPITGFALSITALGLAAALSSKLYKGIEKRVVLRNVSMVYCSAWCVQVMAFSSTADEFIRQDYMYLAACVLLGLATGILYVIPVGIAARISKEKVGLYSGAVVMSFGVGSLIATNLYKALLSGGSVDQLWILGIVYSVLIFASAEIIEDKSNVERFDDVMDIIKTKEFAGYWLTLFLNILIGLTILSNYVSISTEQTGMSMDNAIMLVGLAGLANGFGRIVYSAISDYMSRQDAMHMILLLQLGTLTVFTALKLAATWVTCSLVVISVYGGGFALAPGLMKDRYAEHSAAVYGILLTAWSAAGILCQWTSVSHLLPLSALAIITFSFARHSGKKTS